MLLLFGASIWYLNAHQQIFPFQILVRVQESQSDADLEQIYSFKPAQEAE